jgi:hypothetical protein
VQFAVVVHNQGKGLLVCPMPHDGCAVLAGHLVKRVVLVGRRESQAVVDDFLSGNRLRLLSNNTNLVRSRMFY